MEEFTRVDIFDTKGTEYLFVIGYLIVLIIFWNIVKNPQKVLLQLKDAVNTLSTNILRIPQGIFFNSNHTWTHLGKTGGARVGLDDFLQHVTGRVEFKKVKNPGETIRKGDVMTEIAHNGKELKVFSPISGKIIKTNPEITESPAIVNKDPYGKGWIYEIKPDNWKGETGSCYLAEEATEWSQMEMERFKEFLTGGAMRKFSSEPSMVMLQDGGEIRENVLSDLPGEVWTEFQDQFLKLSSPE